jgi:hypothetical protein
MGLMQRGMAVTLVVAAVGCGGTAGFAPGHPPARKPPDNAVGGFAIQLPDRTLMPGEEVQPCYIFPMERTGPSHMVGGATLNTTPGMHHGNVTSRPKTGEGVRECPAADAAGGSEALDILNGGAVLFGSSTQIVGQEWQSFPTGMAYPVKDGYEIVARMHYLNATTQPLTVAPSYQWYTIDEATVVQELAPFIWEYKNFEIPAGATVTVTGDCEFPYAEHPMHLVNVLPHMHRLGVELDAGVTGGAMDGQMFLKSPGYDPDRGVLVQYDPAVDLGTAGVQGVKFSCTWKNTGTQTVVEGVGVNEMCMMFGYAYPREAAYSALAGMGNCLMTTP